MVREFINYLPSEIVFHIFSKLPIRSIAVCKCVCKSWRQLVGTHEFAKFHLSQSTAPSPCLVFGPHKYNGGYKVFSINEDLDLQHHDLNYTLLTKFIFPHAAALRGSANGLLFLNYWDVHLYICNPITRDYIKLPKDFANTAYGFGASRMSGQHKVVGISHGFKRDNSGRVRAECHVYTLGTRSWRSIAASSGDPLDYKSGDDINTSGAFVNGNLHWLACDVNRKNLISCFDLETEVFSTFPPPRRHCGGGSSRLCVVGNFLSLCVCEDTSTGYSMIIWLAKEYGVEKCWTKEFVITTTSIFWSYDFSSMYPVKDFGDGSVLIAPSMLYYSKTTKTIQKSSGIFHPFMGDAITYTPSFLSLKTFGTETAISF